MSIEAATHTVNNFSAFLGAIQNFIPKLVMVCGLITAMCPPPDPASRFYPFLRQVNRIMNYVALNFGHAQNKKGD